MVALRAHCLYKAIVEQDAESVSDAVRQLIKDGQDPKITDCKSGENLLHVVVKLHRKFQDPRAIPVVYTLCFKGTDVNGQDGQGDTPLHKVVQKEGASCIMKAIMRWVAFK